jgi:hypothetical protein
MGGAALSDRASFIERWTSFFVEVGFPAFCSAEVIAVPAMPDQAEPTSAMGAALLHRPASRSDVAVDLGR